MLRVVLPIAIGFAFVCAKPASAIAGTLHVIAPCSDAQTLGIDIDFFKLSSPVLVDDNEVGALTSCDVVSTNVSAGKHNVRIKLAGKSDFGITSDAGMPITTGSGSTYVVLLGNNWTHADIVDEETGRRYLQGIRRARGQ